MAAKNKPTPNANPTSLKEYTAFHDAYSYFNQRLFSGKLPDVLLTLQRKSKARGYFCAERFTSRDAATKQTVDELAMNPECFVGRSDKEILSTLVHEMTHVEQQHFGAPPKKVYHDKEWAKMMKAVGLYPSSTGMPGGKETGRNMTHYVIDGGAYDEAYQQLAADGFKLNWESIPVPAGEKAKPSKIKHTCPECGQNIWGKPGVRVICGICTEADDETIMQAVEEAA